ncbi:MAG: radical SAM protein, partial [Candidatus Aegiribacteria sp.]|nr:radical SAM protein [Candidatus Aegiribacteria sp.]MBD3294522.1 radical SAM protein [Candidatus Fermentibacteria bacterium]
FYTFRNEYTARGMTPEEIAEEVASRGTSVAGISVHCATEHSMAIQITRAVKKRSPNTKVVLGGYHATFLPEEYIRSGADYVILGEGEERLPKLVKLVMKGEIPDSMEGLAYKGGLNPRQEKYTVDLQDQPFASVELLPLQKYWDLGYSHGPFAGRYMNILTSRGCPYSCSFCQAPAMSGGKWKAKSAARVLEELRFYLDEYGVRDFHIQDENFAIDRSRVEEICRGLMAWDERITFCFPSGLKMETLDETLLDMLIDAGCRYFSLSPETGSKKVLELMSKKADIDKVPRLIDKAFRKGTSTCTFFVTGYPGETDYDRKLTRLYINSLARIGVDEVIMPILTPFPATEAMDEPSLQGFSEYDQLCFSPIWRSDYRELNLYRLRVYLEFHLNRLFFHPLKALQQVWHVLTGKASTKTEMTARRFLRDLYDRFNMI